MIVAVVALAAVVVGIAVVLLVRHVRRPMVIDVGDEIVTRGGLHGRVAGHDGADRLWLEIDDDVMLRVERSSVVRVLDIDGVPDEHCRAVLTRRESTGVMTAELSFAERCESYRQARRERWATVGPHPPTIARLIRSCASGAAAFYEVTDRYIVDADGRRLPHPPTRTTTNEEPPC